MRSPAVSVVIPSYNYAGYLAEAVLSVVKQTWTGWELIIVDDGSKDDSVIVAERFTREDGRVRVLQHPEGKNLGLAATLRRGVEAARGEYVAFLDADDVWLETCLEERMRLAATTGAGVIFNDVEGWREPGEEAAWFEMYVPRIMKAHAQRTAKSKTGAFAMRGAFLVENQIPTFSCAMARRDVLLDCGFDSPVPQWVDRWVWCQAAQKTHFACLPQKLTRWRLHGGNFTSSTTLHGTYPSVVALHKFLMNAEFWKRLRKRLSVNYTKKTDIPFVIFLRMPIFIVFIIKFVVLSMHFGIHSTMRHIEKKLY